MILIHYLRIMRVNRRRRIIVMVNGFLGGNGKDWMVIFFLAKLDNKTE